MDQDMDMDTGLVPNPLQRHQRKAQIQQFLASLSPEEARHVARHLANTDFRTDIVAHIPAELLLIVAKYVDPEDIYNFTNVSRTWREKWMEHHAVRILAERHHPAFRPFVEGMEQLGCIPKDSMAVEFRYSMYRERIHQLGKFQSVLSVDLHNLDRSPFPLDPTFHPDPSEVAGYEEVVAACSWPQYTNERPARYMDPTRYKGVHLYYNGRHAWSSNRGGHVIVDDFGTQLRRVYTVPGSTMRGIQLLPLALGDKLLVTRSDRHIYAFDLMTGTLDTFTMSSIPARAATRGNAICLFSDSETSDSETILWTFASDRSTTLDISHLGEDASGARNTALFHPLLDGVLFLSHSLDDEVGDVADGCLVSEYHQGVFVKLHRFHLPAHEMDEEVVDFEETLPVMDPRQINRYGDHALRAIWYVQAMDGTLPACRVVRFHCFNPLTSEFTLRTFPSFPHLALEEHQETALQAPTSWALWGTRLASCHYAPPIRTMPASYCLPLRVTGEGDLIRPTLCIPPAYCTSVEEKTGIMRRKKQTAKSLLEKIGAINPPATTLDDFALPVGGYIMDNCLSQIDPPPPANSRVPVSQEVWMDGNFTVLRINNLLTIWSFHTDLKPAPI